MAPKPDLSIEHTDEVNVIQITCCKKPLFFSLEGGQYQDESRSICRVCKARYIMTSRAKPDADRIAKEARFFHWAESEDINEELE